MQIEPTSPSAHAPADQFTGDVWVERITAPREDGQKAVASLVRFSPGARTAWHSHALGQTLHIVSGRGYVGTRDGAVIEAVPGQTIYTPPGEEHWHGATADNFMEHLALLDQADDPSTTTTWLEYVDDVAYPSTGEEA